MTCIYAKSCWFDPHLSPSGDSKYNTVSPLVKRLHVSTSAVRSPQGAIYVISLKGWVKVFSLEGWVYYYTKTVFYYFEVNDEVNDFE
jgi:hypothetical protein